jgi:hypothetical protein
MGALTSEQRAMAHMLRDQLTEASDEQLDLFLSGYALGRIAGLLVEWMNDKQRMGFFIAMRKAYPKAFDVPQA